MRIEHMMALTVAALILPVTAMAADAPSAPAQGWSGSGELGFAATSGNTQSQNLDAKLKIDYEDDFWKDSFFLDVLRAKGDVKTPIISGGQIIGYDHQSEITANRFDAGSSFGYKFNPRAYMVGALRYDHDDFAPNRWQAVASLGFGYLLFKDARNELSFEVGPGYKRYQPQDYTVVDITTTPPTVTEVHPATRGEVIARALVNYKLAITDNTSLQETFLAEAGSDNQYYQNDIGLAVSMTKALALKLAYQTRYNSNIAPGTKHVDQLFTTNIVYSFDGAK